MAKEPAQLGPWLAQQFTVEGNRISSPVGPELSNSRPSGTCVPQDEEQALAQVNNAVWHLIGTQDSFQGIQGF